MSNLQCKFIYIFETSKAHFDFVTQYSNHFFKAEGSKQLADSFEVSNP